MTAQPQSRVVIERNASSLRGLVLAGGQLTFYRECSSDDMAACRTLLDALRHAAGDARQTTALLASATQTLRRLNASAPPAPSDEETLHATVDSLSGTTVSSGRASIVLSTSAGEVESLEAWLVAAKLDDPQLFSSTLADLGSVARMIPAGSNARVAIWVLSGTSGSLAVVGAKGVEAVVPCSVAWADVLEAVREALSLRATAAVTKFLFNDLFDFSDVAPRIAQAVAEPIRAALASLPNAPTTFHVSGLARRQSWLAHGLARALGLVEWRPDLKAILHDHGITPSADVSMDSLPPALLPLLHAAVSPGGELPWLSPWRAWDDMTPLSPLPASAAAAPTEAAPALDHAHRVSWSPVSEPAEEPMSAETAMAASSATAYAAPATLVMPPPRPSVRIGARKLMLAPHSPSPLTGWPQSLAHPSMPIDDTPPVATTITTDADPPPATEEPDDSIEEAPAKEPTRERRGRQRVVYMAGVAIVLAAVNAVTHLNLTSDSAEPVQTTLSVDTPSDGEPISSSTAAAAAAVEPHAATGAAAVAAMPASPELSNAPRVFVAPRPAMDGDSFQPTPLSRFATQPADHDLSRLWSDSEPFWRIRPQSADVSDDRATAQPAKTTGQLRIVSDREDLTFTLVDERDISQVVSPGLIDDLPVGRYTLIVSQPGWKPLQEVLVLNAGEMIELAPRFATGRLSLRTVPEGAAVRLGGVLVGHTPLELDDLAPGQFDLFFALPDHDEVRVGGEVIAGRTTQLSFQLDRLDRLARVSELATPPVATLRVAPDFRRTPYIRSGRVLLSFVIDRTGIPTGVRVEDASDRRLVRPCLEVITKWEFAPGINLDGKTVNTRVHQLFQVEADDR